MKKLIIILLGIVLCQVNFAQENPYVYKQDGRLTYVADGHGNRMPDYSLVGYKLGEEKLPNVELVRVLSPSAEIDKDRTQDIQEAIDQLATLPMQANGYRGAILLKAGTFRVDSSLHIHASGIVIKGEGVGDAGTELYFSARKQSNLFEVAGIDDLLGVKASRKKVIDAYVPIGSKTVTVEKGHDFKVGDNVLYVDQKKPIWVKALGMDQLEAKGAKAGRKKTLNWTAEEYRMKYKRVVTAVDGNVISLDAPVMEFADGTYSEAYLEKYAWKGKIEHVGFENFKAVSYFASHDDEDHGWIALNIANVENFWALNVQAQYFGKGLLSLEHVYKATVRECQSSDFKSIISGGRRYGFTVGTNSGRCLIANCISSRGGRHSFATSARSTGPNVFYNCYASGATYSDIGPHHRWAVGTLWENVETPGVIDIQNRGFLGSGHGWAGAQNTFWNCKAGQRMSVNNPPLAYKNWIMGCTTPVINGKSSGQAGQVARADVYSQNKAMPFSLFQEQSKEAGHKEANFIRKIPIFTANGLVTHLDVPDQLWGNRGTLTFAFKLSKEALMTKQLIVDAPIFKVLLQNNALFPVLKAAPQAKEERKERIQFAFFKPDQWYHLSIVWDGPREKFQIFLNGEMQQPSYFSRWTKSDFTGDLSLGSPAIAVRNIALYDESLEEHHLKIITEELDLQKLSGEGRQTFDGGLNLKPYTITLLYEADFEKDQVVIHESDLLNDGKRIKRPSAADWVLEGRAKATQNSKGLVITSSTEGDVDKNHAVLWNTTVFPEDFLLEFEMTAKDARDGLGIIFFAATAHNSAKDVFALHLPKREANFGQYMNGALDCYHTSYWASNAEKGSRESTNLRKNKGFKLVALGEENIGSYAFDRQRVAEKNLVRLLKVDGLIQLETRGQLVMSWKDDGTALGKVLGQGQIGLRHMGHAREVSYSQFNVYKIEKKHN